VPRRDKQTEVGRFFTPPSRQGTLVIPGNVGGWRGAESRTIA